jgi:Asp-tRNA(Asn)/Glu-tRNA(Gln) amidotransferase A subunit family amidase
VSSRALDRLRANLAQASIPVTDADLEAIEAKRFFPPLEAFAGIVGAPVEPLSPDFLVGLTDPASPPGEHAERSHPASVAAGQTGREGAELFHGLPGRLRRGEATARHALEQAEAVIRARDPELNAFQCLMPERAERQARRADAEISGGAWRGALHGVPVAVKDLFDIAGLPTTAGSRIMADRPVGSTAPLVARLEEAGALVVGKTRMPEFAYSPGSNNAHYGPTRNPRCPDRDAGGSSSGSAAAVAAGMVSAAIGSDTGGSIRIPAAFCGLVGLKPTYGLLPTAGSFPLSWSLDHAGTLTHSVEDARSLLRILAPGEVRREGSGRRVPAGAVAGLRVGVVRPRTGGVVWAGEAVAAWRSGLRHLAEGGAVLVEIDFPELEPLWIVNNALLAMEAGALHLPWLRERYDEYSPWMRQRVLAGFSFATADYLRGQQARRVLRERCTAHLERVDLLSTPTQPDGAPALGEIGWTALTAPFNLLGWPAVSVPVGSTSDGRPLGMQLIGGPWREGRVLDAAVVVEAGCAASGSPLMGTTRTRGE